MANENKTPDPRLSLLCSGDSVFLPILDPEGILGEVRLDSIRFSHLDSGEWFLRCDFCFSNKDKLILGGKTLKDDFIIQHGAVSRDGNGKQMSLFPSPTLKGAIVGLSWIPEELSENLVPGKEREKSVCSIKDYIRTAIEGLFAGVEGGRSADGLRSRFAGSQLDFLAKDIISITSSAEIAVGRVKIAMSANDYRIGSKKVILNASFGLSGLLITECLSNIGGVYTPSLLQAFALADLLSVHEIPPSMRDEKEALSEELSRKKPEPKPEQPEKKEVLKKIVIKKKKKPVEKDGKNSKKISRIL